MFNFRTKSDVKQFADSYAYNAAQGKPFAGREFTDADVSEALTKLETWHDDQKGKNYWSSCYIEYHVLSPLEKAIKKNPALLTPEAWERLKKLAKHPEIPLKWNILGPIHNMMGSNKKYAAEFKDVLIEAMKDADPIVRRGGVSLLYRVVNEAGDSSMVEEAVNAYARSLKDDDYLVRENTEELLRSLAENHGVDPLRVIGLIVPLANDKEKYVRDGAIREIRSLLYDLKPEQAGTLREVFRKQAEATHWWERAVRASNNSIIQSIDYRLEHG